MATSSSTSKLNVGRYDRSIRLAAGLILLSLAFFYLSGTWAIVSAIVGLVLLGTGFLNFCPLYRLFGISTRSGK